MPEARGAAPGPTVMKLYLVSLGAGLLVGAIYGLLNVRSPAPPVVALLGLLGILLGEAAVSYLRGHPDVLVALGHRKTFHDGAAAERGPPRPGTGSAG